MLFTQWPLNRQLVMIVLDNPSWSAVCGILTPACPAPTTMPHSIQVTVVSTKLNILPNKVAECICSSWNSFIFVVAKSFFILHFYVTPTRISCKPCIVTSQSQHHKSLTAVCWFIWSVTECLKNDIRPGGPWLFNILFTTESVKLIVRPFLGASWHDMLLHLPKEKRITIRALGNTTSAWLVISALYAVINQL